MKSVSICIENYYLNVQFPLGRKDEVNQYIVKQQTRVVENSVFFQEVEQRLLEGKRVQFRLKGRSMLPFLREDDLVTIAAYQEDAPRKGDIALGTAGGAYVLHRIVKLGREDVLLAGDGNLAQHETIAYTALLAKVVAVKRDNMELQQGIWKSRFLGLCWYRLRWLRRLYVWLKKRSAASPTSSLRGGRTK